MQPNPLRAASCAALIAASVMLAACATTGAPPPGEEEGAAYQLNDPLEPVNRKIFDFNVAFDDYILKPTAEAYRDYVPDFVRTGIRNFFNNLRSPIILANDALQGQGKLAGDTFARLWLNTLLGWGGLVDVGTEAGIPYHDADFGQTLGTWGVPPGPYLVIPILGPSNPRDATGLVAGVYADPANAYADTAGAGWVAYPRYALDGVDTRSRNIDLLDRIRATSLDYYATIESLYDQRRAAQIRHEQPPAE